MQKKISSKRTYKIEVIHYADGTGKWNRSNTGFSVMELMGILSLVQSDLQKLYTEAVKPKLPTNISRKATNAPLIHKAKSQ